MSDNTAPPVPAELKALGLEMKAGLSDLREKVAELKESGDALIKEEIKKLVDEQHERQAKIDEAIKAQQQDFTSRMDELDIEIQKRAQDGGHQGSAAFKSLGDEIKSASLSSDVFRRRGTHFTYAFDAKAITNLGASGGDLLVPQYQPGIQRPGEQALTVLDMTPTQPTTSSSITYAKELAVTNSADYQGAQGTKKPESAFTFDRVTEEVETLAHFVKIAKQMVDDQAQLRSYIESRMLYLLRLKVSGEILAGDGAAGHLNGINTQATAYDSSDEALVTAPQRADRILLGIDQASEAEFPVNGVVLNHRDWTLMRLLKDGQNGYIFGGPQNADPTNVWGVRVAADRAQAVGTWTAGSFTPAALILWVRETANVMLSTENEDDFVKNLVTLLAEMRAALAIYRPAAFVTGNFTFV